MPTGMFCSVHTSKAGKKDDAGKVPSVSMKCTFAPFPSNYCMHLHPHDLQPGPLTLPAPLPSTLAFTVPEHDPTPALSYAMLMHAGLPWPLLDALDQDAAMVQRPQLDLAADTMLDPLLFAFCPWAMHLAALVNPKLLDMHSLTLPWMPCLTPQLNLTTDAVPFMFCPQATHLVALVNCKLLDALMDAVLIDTNKGLGHMPQHRGRCGGQHLDLIMLNPMPFTFCTAHLAALINTDKAWDTCPSMGATDSIDGVTLDKQRCAYGATA
ncbi:hypothetical protein AcV5_003058 [Taiwanofungus camphoratus]|nr:hypothetical protein AcV5_003058 [Antrodia cinnamomea]